MTYSHCMTPLIILGSLLLLCGSGSIFLKMMSPQTLKINRMHVTLKKFRGPPKHLVFRKVHWHGKENQSAHLVHNCGRGEGKQANPLPSPLSASGRTLQKCQLYAAGMTNQDKELHELMTSHGRSLKEHLTMRTCC